MNKSKSSNAFTKMLCLLLLLLWMPICGAYAQNILVKGTILDSQNEPVIGATIQEKGNKTNAVSDIDGNFQIRVAKGAKLVVSYIGMETAEVAASDKPMTIKLQDSKQTLDDVVVVGYVSKARKDLTGSVGSVSGAKLAAVPVSSAAEALQGKIAGVQITTVDGQPGADINIRVRGATSVTQMVSRWTTSTISLLPISLPSTS